MSTSDAKIATMTPAQCRAARGLIGWSQDDLSDESGVSKRSVVRFELGKVNAHPSTVRAIIASLQRAGVVFVPENGDGVGVRLKKK